MKNIVIYNIPGLTAPHMCIHPQSYWPSQACSNKI